ncbi:MAG: DUF5677 domain-containing protein [Pyrinomonadaceae bacterium]
MISDEKVKRDLPTLRKKLMQLRELAESMPPKAFEYDESNHFAFMCLMYLAKQKEHASSVLCLIDGGHNRDAGLIARSMCEGLAQLKWAALDAENRPLRWRAFAYICDWRTMNAKIAKGVAVASQASETIRQGMDRFGDLFLTRKALGCRRKGKPLPSDPYSKDWLGGRGYSSIFSEIKGEILRESIYSPLSSWQHWTCEEMGSVITRGSNKVSWLPPSDREAARSLATAFQCLYEVLEVADIYLEFGFSKQLAGVRDSYVGSLTAAVAG